MDALIFIVTFLVVYLVVFIPLYRMEMRSHNRKIAEIYRKHRETIGRIS